MNTIVTVEIVSAVYLVILLMGQLIERNRSKSSRALNLCILLVLFSLVIDAMAYIFMDASTPFAFRYTVCLLAYTCEGIYFIGFSYYSEQIFREKAQRDMKIFRVLRIGEGIWIAVTAVLFVTGRIVVFENGVEVADNGYPLYVSVYQICMMLCTPVAALLYRKKIGAEAVILLSVFNITPIIGILAAILVYYDYSYVLGAVTLVFIAEFLQRKQSRERMAELRKHEDLEQNTRRIFALEDDFVSLYEVDLESGRYVSFDRNEFYRKNISDKIVSSTEFFEDLRTNIERVVFEEDREALYNVQNRDAIRRELADSEHFDHYYRVITETGTMWLRMRLVYKDAEKKNVIIGVFNAEEEMAAREKEAHVREELLQTNSRLFALEDDFESLYDVELETGHYDVFVKGDFFRDNVLDKLAAPKDYFAELRGNIDAVIYPEDREGLYNALEKESIRRELSENDHFDFYYRLNTEEGYVWFKMRVVYKNAEKKNIIIGVFNAKNDMKNKMLAEQQRKDEIARIEAESSNRAKTEFLFSMSHDIRTPMNAILGYTDIALNHIGETDRVKDSLQKIRTSGGHLLRLINDILEMSRIEAGRMEIVNAPLNAYAVTEGIVNMSEALASTKDIIFKTEISGLKNPYVYADELHINQVIINLISNAIKYTNPGGTVEYRIEQISEPRDEVADYRVTVSDTGIGMSEEFQQHLFESFSREKTSTVSRQEGAGLGLAIVKRIVDIIGGTVRVQSKQGEGSVFTVELPLRVMDEAAIAAYEAEHSSETVTGEDPALTGRKVLLVEDNEMNREIATEILEESGLIIDTAEDGDLAVKKVTEKGTGYYDFILMDIQMPVMNGYEATRAIRAMYPNAKLPIIALSANAFAEDKAASLAAGMDDHVAKPINIKELFDALGKYL